MDDLDVKSGDSASVDLTDASGNSYVYTTSGTTNKVQVTPSNPTCDYVGLTWTVAYAGPSDTAAKIQIEWNELVTRYSKANVAVESDAGNSHTLRFGAEGATASACTNGPKALATNVALNSITWSVEPSDEDEDETYEVSQSITAKLTYTSFAVAITGADGNEGAVAAGTHGFTIKTTLAA